MKILKGGYKEYRKHYAVPHDADEGQFVRNRFLLHLPLRSHGQEGEYALLLNTLSGEILVLSEQEDHWWVATEKGIDTTKIDDAPQREFVQKLIGHDILVSPDADMVEVLDKGRKSARAVLDRIRSLTEGYFSYLIFTTTDCNARCFYCYEKGIKRKRMSRQTAVDVAQFIERNYHINKQEVKIRWFGGEPLYNAEAIDTICDYLNRHGVPFTSKAASNAYLFTPEMQQRAISNWHLTQIQVTLDGTEQIYNRIKNYISEDTADGTEGKRLSPYKRVIDNMLSADRKGIGVVIRVNVDLHNADDLIRFADEMRRHIGSRETNISIYSNTLFDCAPHLKGEHREATIALAQLRLMRHLYEIGLLFMKDISLEPKVLMCMADNVNAVTIQPDGMLGKCEHHNDVHQFSDLHATFFDKREYEGYFQAYDHHPSCCDCPIMPLCIRLKVCQSGDHCEYYERRTNIIEHKVRMLAAYMEYRQGGEVLREAPAVLESGVKIRNLEALRLAAPADVWAVAHHEWAVTLAEGTWSMNFVLSSEIGNHPIQHISVERLDHRSTTAKFCGDTSALRQSLYAIARAYFDEHPDDILVMRQNDAQQRLATRWLAAYDAQHPDSVTMLQGVATKRNGERVPLSIFIDHRCEDLELVCEALSEQYDLLV